MFTTLGPSFFATGAKLMGALPSRLRGVSSTLSFAGGFAPDFGAASRRLQSSTCWKTRQSGKRVTKRLRFVDFDSRNNWGVLVVGWFSKPFIDQGFPRAGLRA